MYYRSPIPYMGNKYKLLKHILPLFPKTCKTFVDLFGGSGTVSMNYQGTEKTIYNDFNTNIVELVKMFKENNPQELNSYYQSKILEYGLDSCSLKREERENRSGYERRKENYNKLREDYNKSKERDYRDLFLLSCYSINHLIRFNTNSDFNASSGADSYNEKNYKCVCDMHKIFQNVEVKNENIFDINFDKFAKNDFIYCFDTETEVLTNNGWKYFKDVDIEKDLFLSREPNTDVIEYVKAVDYIKYLYKGKMWHYYNEDIDLKVTPNHKLFLDKKFQKEKKKYREELLIPTKDIQNKGQNYSFICGRAKWERPLYDKINICGKEFDVMLFARLLGIFLTDGSVNKRGAITIVQKKKDIQKVIEELLVKLGIEHSIYNNTERDVKTYYIARKYLPYFKQFYLKENRRIPREFLDGNKDVAYMLLQGILDGDSDSERRKINVGGKYLANDIQELIIKCGFGSNIHIKLGKDAFLKEENRIIHAKKPYYVVSIKKRKYLSFVKENIKLIDYCDFVYCVTLQKWHTVLVRRNGKMIWCGQCDPPYYSSEAVYNEKRAFGGWGIEQDYELFELLEKLDQQKVKWGLSNVFSNRGKINQHLIDWCKKNKWKVFHLERNYNPFSRGNSDNDEVYICNYEVEEKPTQIGIFDEE